MVSLAERRRVVSYLQGEHGVSERRACQVIGMSRSTQRRRPGRDDEAQLVAVIHELSARFPRFGYRKIHTRVRKRGFTVGRERVRLIRKREGLQVVQKQRRRRVRGAGTGLPTKATYVHHVWSYDFVFDQTSDGRRLKCLTVEDEYSRFGLTIHGARSISAGVVIRILEALFTIYGAPAYLKSDNGPEFVAQQVQQWLAEQGVKTHYIEPGSPWQNGHIESFNAVFRDGCLDRWSFYSVAEANREFDRWLEEYNYERPHGALNQLTPAEFLALCEKQHKAA